MNVLYILAIVLMAGVYLYCVYKIKNKYENDIEKLNKLIRDYKLSAEVDEDMRKEFFERRKREKSEMEVIKQENALQSYNIKSLVKHVNEMQTYVRERNELTNKQQAEITRLNKEIRKLYDQINELRAPKDNTEIVDKDLPLDPWEDSKITEEDIYLRGLEKIIKKDEENG